MWTFNKISIAECSVQHENAHVCCIFILNWGVANLLMIQGFTQYFSNLECGSSMPSINSQTLTKLENAMQNAYVRYEVCISLHLHVMFAFKYVLDI